MLEHKIAQLEERLLSARVITKKEISKDTVSVGATVRLRDMEANKTVEYHIVGSAEANPAENKLSNESPVGKAIIGHKKGEVVEVVGAARRAQVQDPRDQGRLTGGSRASGSPRRGDRPAARRSRSREASAVLARAFHDDPAWSWVLPEREPPRAGAPAAGSSGSGFELTDGGRLDDRRPTLRGAARWLPPGRPARPDRGDALRALRRDAARGSAAATSRFLAYGRAVDDAAGAVAVPGPHWYLAGIGVEPAEQRRGHRRRAARAGRRGRRARRPPVRAADELRARTSPSTSAHGFEIVLEGETPAGGPHAWMMVEPRGHGLAVERL